MALDPHRRGPYKVLHLRFVALCLALLTWSWHTPANGAVLATFPHQDERYLNEGQHEGGAAFVPDGSAAEKKLPVVIFLHGTNRAGVPHLWFGGGGRDLRPLARRLVRQGKVRPFVLAGPSQTVAAERGTSLWPNFDLERFVADLGDALAGRAALDLSAIFVVGHSGAGCNPEGGLATPFHARGGLLPAAVVAIDPCLDQEMGMAFGRRSPGLPLWVLWQSKVWHRDYDAWASALLGAPGGPGPLEVVQLDPPGPNPHDSIVPMAFDRIVQRLVGTDQQPAEAGAAEATTN